MKKVKKLFLSTMELSTLLFSISSTAPKAYASS